MTDNFCHLVTLHDIQFDFDRHRLALKRTGELDKHLFLKSFS